MATKKKTTPVVEKVEKVEEVKEVKEIKNEEKPQVLSSKEKICEFYWIRDEEILDPNVDLSKYNLKPEEMDVLNMWWAKNDVVDIDKIQFDMYRCKPEVKAVIEKYGLHPRDIITEGWLDELTEEEKDIIVEYYNELVIKAI